jgi:ATP-dependent RNA helicase MRH4
LASDLKPSSGSGRLEVAPKQSTRQDTKPSSGKSRSSDAPRKARRNQIPSSGSGRLEAAPARRSFRPPSFPKPAIERDPVPHTNSQPWEPPVERNPSFRRRSAYRSEEDWKRRTGRWSLQKDSTGGQSDAREQRYPSRGNSGRASENYDDRSRSSYERSKVEAKRGFESYDRGTPRRTYSENPAAQETREDSGSFQRKVLGGRSDRYASSGREPRREPDNSTGHSTSRYGSAQLEPRRSGRPTAPRRVFSEEEVAERPSEFYDPPQSVSLAPTADNDASSKLAADSPAPTEFTSPPILPGLLSSLKEVLGPNAKPTPIQSLSLKWLLNQSPGWKQFLLASETGSGKSIAYLLPLLQNLKQAELDTAAAEVPHVQQARAYNPRALILAPTHELSRQLSGFAKSLLHNVKLRVLCASKANVKSAKERDETASKMAAQFDAMVGEGEFEVKKDKFPVDVVVGTPMKLMEMVRGRGWDRKEGEEEENEEEGGRTPRRGRDKMIGFGKWRSKPEMGLANVEWVIVDEADVLFGVYDYSFWFLYTNSSSDPDFQETTRTLLSDISLARGHPVPVTPALPTTPISYPFNLLLTSATIPTALASYLENCHPSLIRLASPRLHHLPQTLRPEYVAWTGGNKFADIERRIRRVWAEDSSTFHRQAGYLSKVLVFCNKSTKVVELSSHLNEREIKNVALTSNSETRKRGSNHHLDGFLRPLPTKSTTSRSSTPAPALNDPKTTPLVLITTSLLSRGLDFDPSIKHVFIVDEPRNMIDFLHRAGRSGRAGEHGKVVVFGKMKGRGSAKGKEVRKRVGDLL